MLRLSQIKKNSKDKYFWRIKGKQSSSKEKRSTKITDEPTGYTLKRQTAVKSTAKHDY